MATETNGIATVNDLASGKMLLFPLEYVSNQCPTKENILSARGTVSGIYASNQLVKYSDVSNPFFIESYTLRITTSKTYSSLALFDGTLIIGPIYGDYGSIKPVSPKNYDVGFFAGSGLRVNVMGNPGRTVSIPDGGRYSVGVKTSVSSPWVIIANLTHVDGDKTEFI